MEFCFFFYSSTRLLPLFEVRHFHLCRSFVPSCWELRRQKMRPVLEQYQTYWHVFFLRVKHEPQFTRTKLARNWGSPFTGRYVTVLDCEIMLSGERYTTVNPTVDTEKSMSYAMLKIGIIWLFVSHKGLKSARYHPMYARTYHTSIGRVLLCPCVQDRTAHPFSLGQARSTHIWENSTWTMSSKRFSADGGAVEASRSCVNFAV